MSIVLYLLTYVRSLFHLSTGMSNKKETFVESTVGNQVLTPQRSQTISNCRKIFNNLVWYAVTTHRTHSVHKLAFSVDRGIY